MSLTRGVKLQYFAYVGLYADEAGESHFEDVSAKLEPVDFAPQGVVAATTLSD